MTRASPGRSSTNEFAGKPWNSVREDGLAVDIQEILDADIGRTKAHAEQLVLLIIIAQPQAGESQKVRVGCRAARARASVRPA